MLAWLNDWLHSLSFTSVFLVIFGLTAIVYKAAFAVRLPILKTVLVVLSLAAGCLLLTLLHYMEFPIIPVLLVIVILIGLARIRLCLTGKKEKNEPESVQEKRSRPSQT
ncbi:MAG: YlaH-like family protein [Thermoactinomyces sp.]